MYITTFEHVFESGSQIEILICTFVWTANTTTYLLLVFFQDFAKGCATVCFLEFEIFFAWRFRIRSLGVTLIIMFCSNCHCIFIADFVMFLGIFDIVLGEIDK